VAIASIVVITVTALIQAATVQPARALATPVAEATSTTVVHRTVHQRSGHPLVAPRPAHAASNLLFDLNTALLTRAAQTAAAAATASRAAATTPAPPATAATAPGLIDTVSPTERVAWERVAMCEEGGNWSAQSSRFSGGLGISRANWDNYGGQQFAPEGAMATEDQQIMVAERIQPNPPDRSGCSGW
jgi:hypothetical protein